MIVYTKLRISAAPRQSEALNLPTISKGIRLLVVTLAVGPEASVAETHWQQRG